MDTLILLIADCQLTLDYWNAQPDSDPEKEAMVQTFTKLIGEHRERLSQMTNANPEKTIDDIQGFIDTAKGIVEMFGNVIKLFPDAISRELKRVYTIMVKAIEIAEEIIEWIEK